VLAVWAFLVCVTSLPYFRAWVYPPPGQAFLGAFYSLPDFYNYLSYVQQAEDGAFVFRNKLVPEPHAAVYVNVEWWLVGRISAAIGRHPTLAYRLFGALATLALVAAVDRWLLACALPSAHRFPALLLVFMGGGLGGVLFEARGPPAWRFLDLTTGLYPFLAILVNPHFVAGTALLAWALWYLSEVPSARGVVLGILLGTLLGVVRPYDLVLLVGIRGALVVWQEPAGRWLRALVPLVGLLPAVVYNYWVFYVNGAFRTFTSSSFPPVGNVLLAVAPVLVLLLGLGIHGRRAMGAGAVFAVWTVAGLAFLLQPVNYSLQFLVDWGLPLLALAALALARFQPRVTLIAAALFSSTGLLALRILLGDNYWFVPAWKLRAMPVVAGACRPRDVALVPLDLGPLVNAYTSCSAYLSHPIMPDYARRDAEVDRFYGETDPGWRAALLDRACVAVVVLPGAHEARPRDWLGEATPFQRKAVLAVGNGMIGIYERPDRGPCPPAGGP
jgi:hypothetical protein